jgi:hypothetical protein
MKAGTDQYEPENSVKTPSHDSDCAEADGDIHRSPHRLNYRGQKLLAE